jgi:uncharacterized protein YpmB
MITIIIVMIKLFLIIIIIILVRKRTRSNKVAWQDTEAIRLAAQDKRLEHTQTVACDKVARLVECPPVTR